MNSFANGNLALAGLALDYGIKTLSQDKVSNSDLKNAIDTIMAAQWTRPILEQMKRGMVNLLFRLLRPTEIKQTEYASTQGTLLGPIGDDNLTIEEWTLWGGILLKYNIHKTIEQVDLRTTIKMLHQGSTKAPLGLVNMGKKQAFALDLSLFSNGAAALLWQCSKCQFEYPTNRTTKRFHNDPTAMPRLIEKISGKPLAKHRHTTNSPKSRRPSISQRTSEL